VSVTRAGELLEQLQRVAWDLAYTLPEAREARLRSARAALERDILPTSPHGLGSRGLDREELGWQLRRLDARETVPLPPAGRERQETAGAVGAPCWPAGRPWPRLRATPGRGPFGSWLAGRPGAVEPGPGQRLGRPGRAPTPASAG